MSDLPNYKNATIDDVARLAGVSSATVSRVINQNTYVHPQTTKKVRDAIDTLHYVPSSAAQTLAGKKTNSIGLIVQAITEVFFIPLLRGIELAASQDGYNLLIHATHFQHETQGYKTLGEHNTDGVLVFANSLDDEELAYLYRNQFPTVLIYHHPPPAIPLPCINIDNKSGALQMMNHLICHHQRKRIIFLRGPENTHDAYWREKGYRQALAENGLSTDENLITQGDFHFDTAAESMRRIIQKGIPFDAVFSADDGSAFGAYAALKEAGIRVPEDVSLVGFDDVPFADHFSPSLTTVQAPTEEVGKLAVESLIRCIHGEDAQLDVLLPTRLILRQSCGCKM